MKFTRSFFPIVGLLLTSTIAFAATPTLDASLQSTLDKYRTKYHIPGLALSVKLPGETATHDYFSGTTALNGDTAIAGDSLFQIGGVTKSFTAALVLQLAAEGKLSLDDTVGKWLTQFPDWKAVTVRQLLNETSGVFDYLAIPDFVSTLSNSSDSTPNNMTLDDLTGMAYNHKPNMSFKTGKKWEPSNTNYALLGLIVQKATGHAFNDELNQRLLGAKFGLGNTAYFPYPQPVLAHLVHGYEADGVTDVSHFNLSWGGPAAGLISNAHDTALWAQALFSGKVLPSAQMTAMTSLVSMKNGQPMKAGDYSMGVGLGIEAGADAFASKYGVVYGYSGNTLGYRAEMVYLSCYDTIAAVTLNNVSQNNKDLTEMMTDVVKILTSSSQWQDYKKANKPDALPDVCKKLWS